MFVEAAKTTDIAAGGMKAVELNSKTLLLCNYEGRFYALERRCGHMCAPLEMGTLEGYILTCPMHKAQFDITTGEALSGPVPDDFGSQPLPERIGDFFKYIGSLMAKIDTHDLKTYPVKVEGQTVKIEMEEK